MRFLCAMKQLLSSDDGENRSRMVTYKYYFLSGDDSMIKKIAVYCGARPDCPVEYKDMAAEFGEMMANHGVDLVYGGGKFGLMGTVANAVLDHGGHAYGVITKELYDRHTSLDTLTDLKITPNMDVRKETMMNEADGLLALPGGLGTLEEIVQAASWTGVGDNNKPVVFFNYNHFYDAMQKELQVMAHEGFLEKEYLDAVCFTADFDEMLQFMENYQAPHFREYK